MVKTSQHARKARKADQGHPHREIFALTGNRAGQTIGTPCTCPIGEDHWYVGRDCSADVRRDDGEKVKQG